MHFKDFISVAMDTYGENRQTILCSGILNSYTPES